MSDHKKVRIVFRFKLAVCILLVLLFMVEINCRNIKRLKREVDKTDEDDSKSETRRSSTENQTERNIMYKKYLEDPLLLDYGRYTPQSFHYVNFQDHLSNRTEAYDKCIDQYIRCVAMKRLHPCVYIISRAHIKQTKIDIQLSKATAMPIWKTAGSDTDIIVLWHTENVSSLTYGQISRIFLVLNRTSNSKSKLLIHHQHDFFSTFFINIMDFGIDIHKATLTSIHQHIDTTIAAQYPCVGIP
ncbi:uncharacterized protein LOC118270777 isoform X1 [Spodoptera frugiperda]|uniref:Uncharacterized protein LOC118270777 isoform X1 n=1 Tax=Spodoptera frugiperda TaxID=7108 RepID=A0A9R0D6Q3_SPOFR|nr:uncharacterized protein LOC118270777 isoform X1 [Spodoptera frugiperda]